MKTVLSEEQIRSYREQGFLVIEDFLDAEELQHWRSVTFEAVEQRLHEIRHAGDREIGAVTLSIQHDTDSYYAQVFTQCLRLADTHPGMAKLILDGRLGEMAGTLAGVDGIRIWHDQALFKPPFGNPTAWHIDDPYWSFSSKDALSIWVALDDATLANGCLWYLPGTHKTAKYETVGIGANQRDLFKVYPEWEQIESVAAPCAAGGAVFHNGLTAHGAGANMTPRPRRAMTCGYMPDGCTFNGIQNILTDEQMMVLRVGDVLDDAKQNPLIWSKRGAAVAR